MVYGNVERLGLVENDPAARSSFPPFEGGPEFFAEPTRSERVGGCGTRVRVEHTADDLANELCGQLEEVFVPARFRNRSHSGKTTADRLRFHEEDGVPPPGHDTTATRVVHRIGAARGGPRRCPIVGGC